VGAGGREDRSSAGIEQQTIFQQAHRLGDCVERAGAFG